MAASSGTVTMRVWRGDAAGGAYQDYRVEAGEGKWAMSTGDNAKFGLNTAQLVKLIERLRSFAHEHAALPVLDVQRLDGGPTRIVVARPDRRLEQLIDRYRTLLPGPDAQLGEITFDRWLARQ